MAKIEKERHPKALASYPAGDLVAELHRRGAAEAARVDLVVMVSLKEEPTGGYTIQCRNRSGGDASELAMCPSDRIRFASYPVAELAADDVALRLELAGFRPATLYK